MEKIRQYNQHIQNWDFEKEKLSEFLRLLSEKNLMAQEQRSCVDLYPNCKTPPKNNAFTNANGFDALENIAFHVAFPHQSRLNSLINEEGIPGNEGVFFSLSPKDVVYYSEFEETPLDMTYFIDMATVKGAKVQTKYDSGVISRRDLEELDGPPYSKNKSLLRDKNAELNRIWIEKNTIPFEIESLKYFRDKFYDWVIVPGPIDVKY